MRALCLLYGSASARAGPLAGALLVAGLITVTVCARVSSEPQRAIEIHPFTTEASCDEEFVRVARSLQPGDELILRGGTYSQRCQRRIEGIHGTAQRPIIIRAAVGERAILTRPRGATGEYAQNNLEIANSSHLVIRGLELAGGSIGIRFFGPLERITFEDNEVHGTDNNAVAMNSGNSDGFVIRRNHIHHTGLLPRSLGGTEGEGLYVGCHDGSCIGSNHLIENNHIHHLRGTSEGGNDGIEIKLGSHGIVVRDNVIHHTNIGTSYPCIFVYGGGPRVNVVERNVMWACGEAIQVASDAIVRNNIILNSDVGITSGPHRQVPKVRRVRIVNNTLYGHRECLHLRWQDASEMVLANNAVYCGGAIGIDGEGVGGAGVQVRANVIAGAVLGPSLDALRFAKGGRADQMFRGPNGWDFWPKPEGQLVRVGAPEWTPEDDFNRVQRARPYDVGAYQSGGRPANSGWKIVPGFKES